MSRTYKDKSWKLTHGDFHANMEELSRWHWEYIKNSRPKLKRGSHERSWMGATPSWWTRLMMGRPQRRQGALWERQVVTSQVEALEEQDTPSISRKPHIYYW